MRGPEHRKNGLLDAVGQLCDDRHGVKPKRSTPEAFAETVRTDLDKWSKVAKEAKEANITPDQRASLFGLDVALLDQLAPQGYLSGDDRV